jgi:hypothetical protein
MALRPEAFALSKRGCERCREVLLLHQRGCERCREVRSRFFPNEAIVCVSNYRSYELFESGACAAIEKECDRLESGERSAEESCLTVVLHGEIQTAFLPCSVY